MKLGAPGLVVRRAFAPVVMIAAVALSGCAGARAPAGATEPSGAEDSSDEDPRAGATTDPLRQAVIHEPFVENRCGVCHASAGGGGKLVASADRLCRSCHGERIERAQVHPPAARSCLICHTPHVSMSEGRLVGPQPGLCLTCHAAEAARLEQTHLGVEVDGTRCSRCHDPHGGSGEHAAPAGSRL